MTQRLPTLRMHRNRKTDHSQKLHLNRAPSIFRILAAYVLFIAITQWIYGCGYGRVNSDQMTAQYHDTDQAADTTSVDNQDWMTIPAETKLITPTPPENPYRQSVIYGDTLYPARYQGKEGLYIKGFYSNGCTVLQQIRYRQQSDTLWVQLTGWQPKDAMCTQVITPFASFDTTINRQKLMDSEYIRFRNQMISVPKTPQLDRQ